MLQVCICDDEKYICKSVEKLIEEFSFRRDIDMIVETFSDPQMLLESSGKFDIIFLDIRFGDQDNGIAIANQLRRNGVNAYIVFMTSIPEYASDGYEPHAFAYLIKPIDREKIFSVLNRIIDEMRAPEKRVEIQTGKQIEYVCIRELRYVESKDRRRYLVLGNKTVTTYERLSEIYDKLPEADFMIVHRSYMVNLKYVTGLNQGKIVIEDKVEIPLGISQKEEFVHRMVNYTGGSNEYRSDISG